jgi:hypothetical protein
LSRFRQGWELTKKSWALLRSNRELFRFPVYGALLSIVLLVVTLLPGLYLIDDGNTVPGVLLVAVGLYFASFIAAYFGVALAFTADAIFHGRDATIGDGFAAANERLGAIAGWAALAAIVGALISLIQQSGSIGEAIVGSLIGAAWSLITFLAIPVITFEGTGPFGTLKRSAHLFKERWRGQVTGNVAIGGIVGLLGILPATFMIVGGGYLWMNESGNEAGLAGGAILLLVGVILLVVSVLIVQAMRGVFGVALYRFASEGEVTTGFSQADFEHAVRTKPA